MLLSFQFIFTLFYLIPLTNTILDDDILYDIKWQSEITPPVELENNFIFTSKRKEKFSCVLPTHEPTLTTSTETILSTEVQPLLENLHSKKLCTYRLDPYWSYELCHGTHIRQYHETKVAGKKTTFQEYYLGYYHSDKQDILTNTDNEQVFKIHYKTINNREVPMLSVRYTDGTQCDINSNQPRETVVFYVCNDKSTDAIINFQEISSCYYEMTVASSKLCELPVFSSAEPNRHDINCYPLENAVEKPRNLKKLEHERRLALKKGGGAQFTMTSADGTTFIISYEYADEADINELAKNINADLKNEVTPPTPIQPTPETNQQPSGNIDREFLEGFLSGRDCLIGGSGWWRYEICYGKHVVQFHEEGAQRTSILLGTWNHQKHVEWVNPNPKKRSAGNTKDRQYVSLFYADGDLCELTNTPRVVEVKLRCLRKADRSRATSMYLVEPDTCSYVLGVESLVFCNLIDYTDEHGIPDLQKITKHFDEQ